MNFLKSFFSRPEEKLYEERDSEGHVLPYAFRPAKESGKPILVILHGNGNNKQPSRFQSKDYNILVPLDRYGVKNNGCWFLGEKGDFFLMRLLEKIIGRLRSGENADAHLYFWGSSMGGYAALLFSMLMRGHAAFCHIPQINLYNSRWYEKNHVFIDFIFGNDEKKHPWRNLASLILTHSTPLPLPFLSFNRFDRPGYMEEHLWPLLKALDQKNSNYFLQIHPQHGHAIHQSVAMQVENFKTYMKEISANANGENIDKENI